MSSAEGNKPEQRFFQVPSGGKVDEILRSWNANGWRAISTSIFLGDLYILFERYG